MSDSEHDSKRRRRRGSSRSSEVSSRHYQHPTIKDETNRTFFIASGIILIPLLLGVSFFVGKHYGTDSTPQAETVMEDNAEQTGGTASPEGSGQARFAVERSDADQTAILNGIDSALELAAEGKGDEAIAMLEGLRDIDDQVAGLDYTIAVFLNDQRKFNQAKRLLDESIARGEMVGESNILRAKILITGQGKISPSSEFMYQEAALSEPFDTYTFFHWAESLRRVGRVREGHQQMKRAALRASRQADHFIIATKLLLSRLEIEDPDLGAELDAALEASRPGGEWLFAAAARELLAENSSRALQYFAEAERSMQSGFYRFLIADSFFDAYRLDPELSEAFDPKAEG